MSNFFSSLSSFISDLPPVTISNPTALGTTISGWFTNKYGPITTSFQQLQGLGPAANPDQLNGLLAKLKLQFSQINGVPGAEYSYESTLAGLVGKSDPTSVELWSSTCNNALQTLQNAAAVAAAQ